MGNAHEQKIRPQRVGEIMDGAFELLPATIRASLPLLLFGTLLGGTSSYLLQTVFQSEGRPPRFIIEHSVEFTILAIVGTVVHTFVSFHLGALVNALFAQRLVSGAFDRRAAKKFVPWYISLYIFTQTMIVGTITWLGFILLVIPGVIYALNRVLASTVLVVEQTGVSESLRRSRQLMSHRAELPWWGLGTPKARVTAILLLTYVVAMFPTAVQQAAAVFLATSWGPAPNFTAFLLTVAGVFVQLVTTLFIVCCFVGFYFDLRCRAEGMDLLTALNSEPAS